MWRQITERDLESVLSRTEIEKFRLSAEGGDDPIAVLLRQECAYVRGCVRAGGRVALSADEEALPESLVMAAMEHLRHLVLTRMNVTVNESRTRAYERADELLGRVRAGEFVPEAPTDAADAAGSAARPATGKTNPEKRLLD